MSDLNILLACPRGLEETLYAEVLSIIGKKSTVGAGFVRLNTNWQDIYLLNLHSRIASRVLCRVAHGAIQNENDVYNLAKSVAWTKFFSVDKSIKIRAEGRGARVRSLNFIGLKVKDAICDIFRSIDGTRPNVDKINPDIRIVVYLNDKTADIYLDTSGEALFKRGYRQESGEAPIRENLAAGLLLLSGYDGSTPFFDPMCGSGTIAIEAAWIATNRASGLLRHFAFEKLNIFQQDVWQKLRTEAINQIITPNQIIHAADSSRLMIKYALKNAQAAQVDEYIRFDCRPFEQSPRLAKAGYLISNPPYGERIDEQQNIRNLCRVWSTCLKQNFSGWTVGLISADLQLNKFLRLAPKRKFVLFNGKLDCRLFIFDMVAGSNRK